MNVFVMLVVAFVCIVLLYQIIPKMPDHKQRKITSVKTYDIAPSKTVDEIEKEKEIKQLRQKHEDFVALMNYDVSTAYRKKSDFE
jgi:hypothetical protein